jgi:hypothetical protein
MDDAEHSIRSDVSTYASDYDDDDDFQSIISDADSQSRITDDASDFTPCAEDSGEDGLSDQKFSNDSSTPEKGTGTNRVTLSLVDMVADTATGADVCANRCKLRTCCAQPFHSVSQLPVEVNTIIAHAAEVLGSDYGVEDVQVHSRGMGSTTMLVGHCRSASPDVDLIFQLVKDTLLRDAAQSDNTYILGYTARPFVHVDALSFSLNLGYVPAAHQNTACWDFYKNGFCRRASCRWDHPKEMDMMRVIVMIKRRF